VYRKKAANLLPDLCLVAVLPRSAYAANLPEIRRAAPRRALLEEGRSTRGTRCHIGVSTTRL